MPNESNVQPMYVVTGKPDTVNETPAYAGGQLGQVLEFNDRTYQYVQLDSGATASTATGVVAANQLAFWKDKDKYLVTNDSTQALGHAVADAFRNFVAGVFRSAVTAGNYCYVLQKGDNIPVKNTGGTAGTKMIAATGTSADTTQTAVGTAATHQLLGIERDTVANGNVNADLDIASIP